MASSWGGHQISLVCATVDEFETPKMMLVEVSCDEMDGSKGELLERMSSIDRGGRRVTGSEGSLRRAVNEVMLSLWFQKKSEGRLHRESPAACEQPDKKHLSTSLALMYVVVTFP
jgi:hypothetical protein